MKWPDRTQVIVNSLAAKHPDLVQGDDEARRKLTGFFAEQCRFELGTAWGTKRYGGGPPSVDVVAYKDNSIFVGWDTQLAGGVIAQWPESIDLSQDPEQKFIEVDPVDHLGSSNPIPNPPPAEPPVDLKPVLDKLDEVLTKLNYLEVLAESPVVYEGQFRLSYFSTTRFTLIPKP